MAATNSQPQHAGPGMVVLMLTWTATMCSRNRALRTPQKQPAAPTAHCPSLPACILLQMLARPACAHKLAVLPARCRRMSCQSRMPWIPAGGWTGTQQESAFDISGNSTCKLQGGFHVVLVAGILPSPTIPDAFSHARLSTLRGSSACPETQSH